MIGTLLKMKYELCIDHIGDRESAVEFAQELIEEFGCDVVINEINDKHEFVRTIEVPDKPDKKIKTG